MEKSVLFDLEHNRKKLNYYIHLKEKSGPNAPFVIDKWIEIYHDRIQRLKYQAQELGLGGATEKDLNN